MEIESIFHFLKNFVKTHCVENFRGINNLVSIFEKQIYNGRKKKFRTLQWNFGQVWRIHENDWGEFIPFWNWHPMCRMLEFASKVIYWGVLTTVRVCGIKDLQSFWQQVLVTIFLYFNYILPHQFYLPKVIIHVQNGTGVLRRLV